MVQASEGELTTIVEQKSRLGTDASPKTNEAYTPNTKKSVSDKPSPQKAAMPFRQPSNLMAASKKL